MDDHTLEQKFHDPGDRALALQLLVKTPAKTWGRITPDTPPDTNFVYGFEAYKTHWHYHVHRAVKLVQEIQKTWPMRPWAGEGGKLNLMLSYYMILEDAAGHGELHTIAHLVGADNVETPQEFYNHSTIELLYSNRESPDMDEIYMKKYPGAPTNVLSKNSREWQGLKFVYSAGHVAGLYANRAGWPKKRNSEREMYNNVMPPIAHAVLLPWTWEGAGVFRAEYATTIDDRIASTMRQKYGEDLAMGPANIIGPFQSKRAAKKDGSQKIDFTWPRASKGEGPYPGACGYVIAKL